MVWSSLAIFSDGRVDQVRDLKYVNGVKHIIVLLTFKNPMVWSSLAVFSDGRVDQVRDLK